MFLLNMLNPQTFEFSGHNWPAARVCCVCLPYSPVPGLNYGSEYPVRIFLKLPIIPLLQISIGDDVRVSGILPQQKHNQLRIHKITQKFFFWENKNKRLLFLKEYKNANQIGNQIDIFFIVQEFIFPIILNLTKVRTIVHRNWNQQEKISVHILWCTVSESLFCQ